MYVFIRSLSLAIADHDSLPKEPSEAHQSFSSSQDPTVWRTIPVLEYLQENWGNMAKHSRFSEISHAIRSGLENLGKWYRKTNDTDAYFICLGKVFRSSQSLKQHRLTDLPLSHVAATLS